MLFKREIQLLRIRPGTFGTIWIINAIFIIETSFFLKREREINHILSIWNISYQKKCSHLDHRNRESARDRLLRQSLHSSNIWENSNDRMDFEGFRREKLRTNFFDI
mgnify:CR=1 FL=1